MLYAPEITVFMKIRTTLFSPRVLSQIFNFRRNPIGQIKIMKISKLLLSPPLKSKKIFYRIILPTRIRLPYKEYQSCPSYSCHEHLTRLPCIVQYINLVATLGFYSHFENHYFEEFIHRKPKNIRYPNSISLRLIHLN